MRAAPILCYGPLMRPCLSFLALLALTACNREERPAPPTAEEDERLDEAEELLNEEERRYDSSR